MSVEEFLLDRGCSAKLASRGLGGLLKKWTKTVKEIEDGWSLGLDDYLNDMDVRQILEEVLDKFQHISIPDALDQIDTRYREATKSCDCLWGEEAPAQEGWTTEKNWWYFRKPHEGFDDE